MSNYLDDLLGVEPKHTKNVRHSSEQPNWQTPEIQLTAARIALGGTIDFDPWSCVSGNARVKANMWYGPDHPDPRQRDGFAMWPMVSTVFCNHPGGTTARAWARVTKELCDCGEASFERAIWEGFSVEQLCTLGPKGASSPFTARYMCGPFYPVDFSIVLLRQRVHYLDPDKPDRPSRPGHANYVLGIGTNPALFEIAYQARGQIIHGDYTRLLFPDHFGA